jgi:ribonuclease R
LVETLLLGSMARAAYQPDDLGHFGLDLPHYVHFTSPIRRHPDLLVHRAIKHVLSGEHPTRFPYSPEDMAGLAIQGIDELARGAHGRLGDRLDGRTIPCPSRRTGPRRLRC